MKKYQYALVRYNIKKGQDWKLGIAYCWKGFGLCDVAWIIDAKTGKICNSIWNYTFINEPFTHMETEFTL